METVLFWPVLGPGEVQVTSMTMPPPNLHSNTCSGGSGYKGKGLRLTFLTVSLTHPPTWNQRIHFPTSHSLFHHTSQQSSIFFRRMWFTLVELPSPTSWSSRFSLWFRMGERRCRRSPWGFWTPRPQSWEANSDLNSHLCLESILQIKYWNAEEGLGVREIWVLVFYKMKSVNNNTTSLAWTHKTCGKTQNG